MIKQPDEITKAMVELCQPLEFLNLTFFNHIQYNLPHKRISLCNNDKWIEYFNLNLFNKQGYLTKQFKMPAGNYLWLTLPDDGVRSKAREYFNIDHGFTIVKKSGNEINFYLFASTQENFNVNEFYLNHVDLLERFINYYHEQAEKLILLSLKKYFKEVTIYDDNDKLIHKKTLLEKFRILTQLNKFRFSINGKTIVLTKRQFVLAMLYAKGYSIKQIARLMMVEVSTVLSHLSTIKQKIGFQHRHELQMISEQKFCIYLSSIDLLM